MEAIDLFLAVNDVEDRFIIEASQEYRTSRVWFYRAAAVAAVLVVVLAAAKINHLQMFDEFSKENVGISQKTWEEKTIYEKYVWLDVNGTRYVSTAGECSKDIGELLGEYMVSGIRDERQELKTERTVKVYEISGVSKSFAVAVQFEETGEWYAYYTSSYTADSYSQFAKDTCLKKYLQINRTYVYEEGKKYVSECGVSLQVLEEYLFSGEDIPMFMTLDFPEEFLYGEVSLPEQNGNFTVGYSPNSTLISSEIEEFCRDKEYGKELVGFSVDYSLLGEKNISIGIFSGGFVSTNIGGTGKSFYVGKEKVDNFVQMLKNSLEFEEVEKKNEKGGDKYWKESQ